MADRGFLPALLWERIETTRTIEATETKQTQEIE